MFPFFDPKRLLESARCFLQCNLPSGGPNTQLCGFADSQTHRHIICFLITQWEKLSVEHINLSPQHFLFLFDASLLIPPPPPSSLALCERIWKSLKYLTHITVKKEKRGHLFQRASQAKANEKIPWLRHLSLRVKKSKKNGTFQRCYLFAVSKSCTLLPLFFLISFSLIWNEFSTYTCNYLNSIFCGYF